jgi:hypothetical protein
MFHSKSSFSRYALYNLVKQYQLATESKYLSLARQVLPSSADYLTETAPSSSTK